MTWMILWKILFVVMFGLFALMASIGTILGALDIRRLLRHLRDAESAAARPSSESSTESDRP